MRLLQRPDTFPPNTVTENIVGERVRDSKTRDVVLERPKTLVYREPLERRLHGILCTRQLCVQPVSMSFETNPMRRV